MMNYFQLGIPTFALISKTQEDLARSVSKRRVIRDFSSYTFVKIRGKISSDRQRKATRHINAMNEQRSLGTRTLKTLIEIKTSGRAKTRYPKRKKKKERDARTKRPKSAKRVVESPHGSCKIKNDPSAAAQ